MGGGSGDFWGRKRLCEATGRCNCYGHCFKREFVGDTVIDMWGLNFTCVIGMGPEFRLPLEHAEVYGCGAAAGKCQ
jgi:hypothetical protein